MKSFIKSIFKPGMLLGIFIACGMFGFIAARVGIQMASSTPENLGVEDGNLSPCPESPNCVSSQAPPEDDTHYIAPLRYENDMAEAKEALLQVLNNLPRATVTTVQPNYIHMETRSPTMGFVDDNEFYFPEDESGIIHMRAAARLGYSDMGANRERLEEIHTQFAAANTP